jgi:capsular exopolysaccharide synthesis family protein
MSRIHEALKKAEQERAAALTADPAAQIISAPTPAGLASHVLDGGSVSTAIFGAPPPVEEMTGDFLRFEDLRTRCSHPVWKPDPNVNIFFNSDLSARGAEQFRTLRSRLYQLRNTMSVRTLLVTSSIPGEGKTFVSNNLAQAIVRQPDRRVLLIDADLRCSRLHVPMGAPPSPGLTDYLRGEADEMAVIQHGQEGNLCFIAGGSDVTNPSELLMNGRLKKLLARLTPVFDWVILDSPPCLPVADATVLADLCDGVLMVVRAGLTPSETAQKACLEMQGKNVLGVVLNAVEESHLYGEYYYQGYGYGQNQGQDERRVL